MSRLVLVALVLVAVGTPFASRLAGWASQVVVGGVSGGASSGSGQQRDPSQPSPPMTRRIPIGTAVVHGTVTTADTGRPVRGARVSLNGTVATPARGVGGPVGTSSAPGLPGALPPTTTTSLTQMGAGPGRGAGVSGGISGASRAAITNASGEFVFEKLPAGQYSLSVSREQFLMTSYGQKKPGGTGQTFALADGQKTQLNLQMVRGAVITGQVMTEDGDPLSNSQIRAFRYAMVNGVKRLNSYGYASTDDRGMYRIFGLQPGDYVISATPNTSDSMMNDRLNAELALIEQAIASGAVQPPAAPGLPSTVTIPVVQPQQRPNEGPPPGYLPIYHPNAAAPTGSTLIQVAGGDERANVDIRVRFIQASNIQGTLTNPPGPGLGVQVSLVNDNPNAESGGQGTRPDANGQFTFRNLAPGDYTVMAQVVPAPTMTFVNGVNTQPPGPPPQLTDEQKWWGRATVSVAGEPIVTTSLTLRPGRTISGQVLFEMERPPDLTRSKITVTLNQAPGVQQPMYSPPTQAELTADGRFTLKGVAPGRYVLRAQTGIPKSVMVNGVDILDFPLEFNGTRDVTDVILTVTDRSTEVSGTLTDAVGKPAVDYTIVAAATDERFWTPGSRRVMVSRPGPDGRYTFRSLPTGSYMLAAVTDLEPGGHYDPELLRALAGAAAMRITLSEGIKVTHDLRVVK